jgi:hypothetical protein
MALKVQTSEGHCIGYVPKDSWLRPAIHHRGQACTASILDIRLTNRGIPDVVLAVALGAQPEQ